MTYQPVKTHDNDAYSDDMTVYEPGVESSQNNGWLTRSSRRINDVVHVFLALSAIVIMVLLTLNLVTLRSTLRKQEILEAQHSNHLVDTLPLSYGRDRRFMTLDPQYDHLWNEWTADAQIMVPGELPGEGLLQGAYSMFHQMHCLASFRRAIQSARAGEDPGFDYLDNGHWPHCFDYLRKSILCWADDTVEVGAVVNGKRKPFIDGTSTIRQCRSPELMYERMRLDEKAVEKANREDGLDHEPGRHIPENGIDGFPLNLTSEFR